MASRTSSSSTTPRSSTPSTPSRHPPPRSRRLSRPRDEKVARQSVRALVLPLHGHLAPAAWALGGREEVEDAARPAVGYVQTGGGALPGSLSRDVAELRERGLLAGHVTAAPAYGGEHEAISVAGALDAAAEARLGRRPGRAGPGDHRLRLRVRPRRHGGPRQRARGARAGAADDDLAAALLGRPARAPPRGQPSHPHRARAAARAPRRRRARGGGARSPPPSGTPRGSTGCARRRQTWTATRPAGCRGGRWEGTWRRTRSSSPRRSPRALPWAMPRVAPCAARDEAPAGRTSRHGDRGQAAWGARAGRPGGGQALRGARPRLPLLPGAGAGPLAQHAQRLPHRPPPVRRIPRRARGRRAQGAPGGDRRVPRRPGHGQRAPGPLLGVDDPPQGRLPALLLQAPAPRRADRRRPDRGADGAASGQEAAAGPQLRRGPEAARIRRAATSPPCCATVPCSR